MMLTIRQYQILNSCANDYELFYYPFAKVNYGGQVFLRSLGDNFAQYAEDKTWEITVPSELIIDDIARLTKMGLLHCRYTSDYLRNSTSSVTTTADFDFTMYKGYSCLLWDEHIEKLGYGPHEFKITEAGIKEIDRPAYRAFDKELGWSKG